MEWPEDRDPARHARRGRRRIRAEVEDEIRFHLERRAAELELQGLSRDAAWEEAMRRFGDVEATRSSLMMSNQRREARLRRRDWLGDLRQDVVFGVRQLVRRPVFTVVAALTLAVGIGANTAIFSAADHVLLRPLPYAEVERVVTLWETDSETGARKREVSPGNFLSWRERSSSFSAVGLVEPYSFDVTGADGPPEAVRSWLVTAEFFEALGVRPVLGRGFPPESFERGGPRAVMISYGFWQRRFAADPGVIGRAIQLDDAPATVVGVLPPALAYPEATDLWMPKVFRPGETEERSSSYMLAVGRLAPGVSVAQAQADLDRVAAQLATEYPRTNATQGVNVVPLETQILGEIGPPLLMLLAAVGFVLLIACANVAGLLLARGAERERELAVRAALGAGQRRLTRQLVTESLVLAGAGGALGIALGWAGVRALTALAPPDLPRLDAIAIDLRVLAFAIGATALTAMLFGLAPAVRFSRPELLSA
ncbi:MAG: ABC transporter permease, partial [Longimicrobiales bacterium]